MFDTEATDRATITSGRTGYFVWDKDGALAAYYPDYPAAESHRNKINGDDLGDAFPARADG